MKPIYFINASDKFKKHLGPFPNDRQVHFVDLAHQVAETDEYPLLCFLNLNDFYNHLRNQRVQDNKSLLCQLQPLADQEFENHQKVHLLKQGSNARFEPCTLLWRDWLSSPESFLIQAQNLLSEHWLKRPMASFSFSWESLEAPFQSKKSQSSVAGLGAKEFLAFSQLLSQRCQIQAIALEQEPHNHYSRRLLEETLTLLL